MKIQLASDLHLERLEKRFPATRIIEPVEGADVLVLAGDIHEATKAVDAFGDWPVPVLYVAGNHEFYGHSWEQTRIDIRRACAGTSIRFMDNDVVELGGVRFLGCTLWTDFKLRGLTQTQWMREVGQGLNDYCRIVTQQGVLSPRQTLEDHEQSRRWLEHELAKPFEGKTVVVTHHGPHPLSIHPRFVDSRVNAGFVSDLTPLLFKADLWLHGHVHSSHDYHVGGCRVVANPAGYVLNASVAMPGTGCEFENCAFNPRLVLDITQDVRRMECPPQATTDAELQMQLWLLREPVRECVVTVEYVDASISFADAREDSGGRVGIGLITQGIDWKNLAVGTQLFVAVTQFNFAVTAVLADE